MSRARQPAPRRREPRGARRGGRRPRGHRRHRRLQGRRDLPAARRRRRPRHPGAHAGGDAFCRHGDVLGARLRTGAHGAVRAARPDPAHPPCPEGRPRPRRAGDGELPRRVRSRSRARPARRDPARDDGSGRGLPGDARRDVAARLGPGEPRDPRPAGRDGRPPESGRLAGGDEGPGRLADPAAVVAAAAEILARRASSRACRCSSRPAAPGNRSTPSVISATVRPGARATPSPRRPVGAAPRSPSSRRRICPRPGTSSSCRSRRRTSSPGQCSPARPPPTSS